MADFNVVLIEPEIPQNTGNIVRLCACTNCDLYLVGKLGFVLDDKHLKRAGLDYWEFVNVKKYNTFDELRNENPKSNFYFFTTKTKTKYTDTKFQKGDFLVFGPETRGIDESLLKANWDWTRTIPMAQGKRSLNLSNSVAVTVYECVRQNNTL